MEENVDYEEKLRTLGVTEETLLILKDEGINCHSFFELNEDDLKSMKIKLGHVKIILKIIRENNLKLEDKIIGEFVVADNSGALSKVNQSTAQKTKDFPLENMRNADKAIPGLSSSNQEMTIISDNTFSVWTRSRKNHVQGSNKVRKSRKSP